MALGRQRPTIDPERIAIDALGYLAADPERLDRFLALTGLSPDAIRASIGEPGFLGAVLDHVMGDESLLLAFATEAGLRPEAVTGAHRALAGGGHDFE